MKEENEFLKEASAFFVACKSRYLHYCGWYDRYSNRTGNSCYGGRNTGKPAGLPFCSLREKEYDVTYSTELQRILHKNFFIWRCQMAIPFLFPF